jgi:hypothetical protein
MTVPSKLLTALLLLALGVALLGFVGLSARTTPDRKDRPAAQGATIAAPSLPTEGFRFAVIGDYGNNSVNEGHVASLVKSWAPAFIITTGDNNYRSGAADTIDRNIGKYYSDYIGNYQGRYGDGSPTNRFWPSLGNHDWQSIQCEGQSCSGPYQDYFILPGNERYYDVAMGLMHLFVVDSSDKEPNGNTADSTQATWLRERLAASTACFDVVVFHHPPYSSGKHGSSVELRWPFAAWGADAVMNGHEHSYERLDVAGMPYFVNGLGGRSVYEFSNVGSLPPGVESKMRYNANYGAMLVTVSETGLTSQFFDTEGTLVDSYTLAKNCALTNTATASVTPTETPTATATLPATGQASTYLSIVLDDGE